MNDFFPAQTAETEEEAGEPEEGEDFLCLFLFPGTQLFFVAAAMATRGETFLEVDVAVADEDVLAVVAVMKVSGFSCWLYRAEKLPIIICGEFFEESSNFVVENVPGDGNFFLLLLLFDVDVDADEIGGGFAGKGKEVDEEADGMSMNDKFVEGFRWSFWFFGEIFWIHDRL